jgi:hypothetical protein
MHLRCFVVFSLMVTSNISLFSSRSRTEHVRVEGWLLNHRNVTICKKTEINELFAWVHWGDADHTQAIPVSLAFCYKLRVSVASEIRQGSVDSLFNLRGHIYGEQSLPCQNKQLARLWIWNSPDAFFSIIETRANSAAKIEVSFLDHTRKPMSRQMERCLP